MKKPRKQKKARNMVVLGMLLTTKGGPMRDRRERRINDARRKRDFDREEW